MSYRISNWSEYNKNLINRGNIIFWFSEDAIKKWKSKKSKKHFGRPFLYSDDAIICALTLRYIYNLPLRALQGFLKSLVVMLKLSLPIPSYTQICRRSQKLKVNKKISRKNPTDIVFDASGFKVYGEGEWKVRTHGKDKRRIWKKLHIGICPDTHEIILQELTDSNVHDAKILPEFLKILPKKTQKILGDGIYDIENCYEAICEKYTEPIIPPRKNAKIGLHKHRDKAILEILGLGGDDIARSIWKKLKNYHRRSLVETAFYRIKTILGEKLKGRKMNSQKAELMIKLMIINKMNKLGMPKSYAI